MGVRQTQDRTKICTVSQPLMTQKWPLVSHFIPLGAKKRRLKEALRSVIPLTAWLVQASQDQGPNAREGMRIGVIAIAVAVARPPDY